MEQPPAQDADQPTVSVPSCYRHPGRETYLSCSRCGRPACPDCLRSAPVGQQCVECIREGGRTVRAPRTLFGGRIGSGAPVTWTLVALNVVLYLTEWVYPRIVDYLELVGSGFDPALNQQVGVAHGEAYRLLTSAFLHAPGLSGFGPAHIIFNMWALIVVGPALERLLGAARYLAVYLLSALGGAVLFYLLAPVTEPAIGASGAIFGLFGAWFVASRRLRVDSRGIVFLIVINLVITFAAGSLIAWQDHVGGLITGGLLMAAYAYAPRQRRRLVQVGATAVVIAVLVIAVLVRDSRLASAALGQGVG